MSKRRWFVILIFVFLSACTTIGPEHATPVFERSTPIQQTEAHEEPLRLTPANFISTPVPGKETLPTPTTFPATYYQFETDINPLTGLKVADPTVLDRRPVMVKVSNWPREGRPHAGLSSADLVFEYFIGHQMNRFLAVYYGEDADVIGPVRSGRLVDAQLTNLYQGLLAYGDADPQVDVVLVEELGERALTFSELPCPPMCGETTHSATGVFADSGEMSAYARELGIENGKQDLRGMYFRESAPLGDDVGSQLRVEYANFSIMEWRYNQDAGKYQLWMEDEVDGVLDLIPIPDRNNDEPILFDNLVVMYAEYIEYAPSLHDIVVQNVPNPQPALFFRDGVLTYGTWRTPDPQRPIIFETYDGGPIPFKPGKTWIVIVGMSSNTVHPGKGEWKISFGL